MPPFTKNINGGFDKRQKVLFREEGRKKGADFIARTLVCSINLKAISQLTAFWFQPPCHHEGI